MSPSKMRIAVNLRQYFKGQIGGMENYVRNILARLDSQQLTISVQLTIFVQHDQAGHVREFAPGAELIEVRHETAMATMATTLKEREFDLLFCPLLV